MLGGAPGVGKTSLALQMATAAAREGTPALYVTYENSPENLVLKWLCASARMTPTDIERGFADLDALEIAALDQGGLVGKVRPA